MTTSIGLGFILGGAHNVYKGIKLLRSRSNWFVAATDRQIIYIAPKGSRESSFTLDLNTIANITIEQQPADSSAEDLRYITSCTGQRYFFGYGENLFNADKFIHHLSDRGVEVLHKPRS